ncbi:RyR domain-containing protein [Roseospira visakhapatnamensis]|uniref:Ryanodine receptor Ryr domain-containing protein n=1 Tax=Roseospira visakhapatnamensis TaxID=390880 RepID=A0A7W6RAZ0_9PROT|nr:RyR domain-containing protein [Roseospira visakhapatnamensis]MBB4265210.1 hypothetical protein [Roseospira visakhapatnamensis]
MDSGGDWTADQVAQAQAWARAACYRAVPGLTAVARGTLTLAVLGEDPQALMVLAQVGRLIGRPYGAALSVCLPGRGPDAARRLLEAIPGLTTLFQPLPRPRPETGRPLLVFNAAGDAPSSATLVEAPARCLAGQRAAIVHPPPGRGAPPDEVARALLAAGLIGVPVDAAPRGRRSDDLVLLDRLAATIHGFYLENAWTRGEGRGSSPALEPWERLPETYRHANRAQADHLFLKLDAAGLIAVPTPRFRDDDAVAAPAWSHPARVEHLAELEHDRWASDRLLDGWVHGPRRDNARKVHPDLLPYEALSEDVKEKDRVAVLTVPLMLRLAGLAYRPIRAVALRGAWPWGDAPPGRMHQRRLRRSAGAAAAERAPLVLEYAAPAGDPGACAAALSLARDGVPVALDASGHAAPADPAHQTLLAALIPLCRRVMLTEAATDTDLTARWRRRAGLIVERAAGPSPAATPAPPPAPTPTPAMDGT